MNADIRNAVEKLIELGAPSEGLLGWSYLNRDIVSSKVKRRGLFVAQIGCGGALEPLS